MKLGLILECSKDGTDHQVYEYVIGRLCPSLEITVTTSGAENKPQMIEKCGTIASLQLEKDGCDAVAIIWDLMPRWGGKPCRKTDVAAITKNLNDAGVDLSKVKLKRQPYIYTNSRRILVQTQRQ